MDVLACGVSRRCRRSGSLGWMTRCSVVQGFIGAFVNAYEADACVQSFVCGEGP